MKQPDSTIHLICNAHLDPVWKWDWEEGLTEALSTFETAADLLDESPDLIFNHNESVLYQWVLEYRPDLFKRIQRLVAAGRWHIAGGWFLQPDCNMPDGESFVRQILVGRRFFQSHFGLAPELAYNFDAFGHHGNLPQILRKSGYRGYVHFRPDQKDLELPGDFYRWEGIDGSRVLVYRPPLIWYGTDDHHELSQRIESAAGGEFGTGQPIGIFWGMGDHGGGATRDDLRVIRELQKNTPSVVHSTTDALLADYEASGLEAPIWKGDLQRVFTGCYTSVSATKRSNRRSEALVQLAERYATLAWWALDQPYPTAKMDAIWQDVLFNQFHDILPGSSTLQAMEGTYEIAGRAMKNAREVVLDAQLALMAKDQPREPLTVVVFNPHPHAATLPVDLEYMVAHRPILTRFVQARVTDSKDHVVPCQDEMPGAVATRFDWRKRVVFEAEVPALGHAEFQIHLDDRNPGPPSAANLKSRETYRWQTPFLDFAIDPKTGLVDCLNRRPDGSPILTNPGGSLVVFKDGADAWGTDCKSYDQQVGRFQLASTAEAAEMTGQLHLDVVDPIRVIESGPVRSVIECLFVFRRSTAAIRYHIYNNRPEVEVEVRVIWNQPNLQLKWCWPTHFKGGSYLAEIPYGDITRPMNEGEHTHLRWLALSDPSGDALGITGLGPSGHDVRNGEARISLLRSAIYCHGFMHSLQERRFHDFMDLGESRFRFCLLATRDTDLRSEMAQLTDRLALKPGALVHYPLAASPSKGVPSGKPLVRINGKGLQLGALKPSEDGEDLIVRIAERSGAPQHGSLEVIGIPEPITMQFEAYEIKTLRISRNGTLCECDLLEQPLDITAPNTTPL